MLACNEFGQEAARLEQIPPEIGAYDISDKRVLGRGAFSLVFKGKHRNTGAIVAVKAATIVPENPTGFHAELKANRVALGHPNVV
eukprot:gene30464-29212_t